MAELGRIHKYKKQDKICAKLKSFFKKAFLLKI